MNHHRVTTVSHFLSNANSWNGGGRKMVFCPFVPSLFCCLPRTEHRGRKGKESNNAMPTLPCSADDKNEIRGSHIDNPDAEREDTNNAQTRPRFFTPLSCLSHHAKPSGRRLSPPLIPVFWSTFSSWARIPNSECRGRCNNNHRDSARTDSYSPPPPLVPPWSGVRAVTAYGKDHIFMRRSS